MALAEVLHDAALALREVLHAKDTVTLRLGRGEQREEPPRGLAGEAEDIGPPRHTLVLEHVVQESRGQFPVNCLHLKTKQTENERNRMDYVWKQGSIYRVYTVVQTHEIFEKNAMGGGFFILKCRKIFGILSYLV